MPMFFRRLPKGHSVAMYFRRLPKVYWAFLFLLFVTVAQIFPYLKQRSSARWVEKQGGWIRTEPSPWLQKLSENLPPKVQDVVQDVLEPPKDGYDWWNPFHEVTWVDVYGIEMKDDDLRRLNDFPQLEVARLNNANITGESFKDIRSLEKVGTVTLQNSSVTDDTLVHLPDVFPNAWAVLLCGTDIASVGVGQLGRMPKLWQLSYDRPKMNREDERPRDSSGDVGADGGDLMTKPPKP